MTLLLFWNNKLVESMVLVKGFMQQCKRWNRPATSAEELHTILNLNPDKREKIVQTELSL